MWVILKLLLVGIEVLPVSLRVRVAVRAAVSVSCTGMTVIVVVMVMVRWLPLLRLIYMGTMAWMTVMAVPMSSSTGMAVVVVVVVVMRLSCLLELTFGGMMLMLVPVTLAAMVVVVVVVIMVRFSGLSGLSWVHVVFSFAHLVGLVGGVLARTSGEIWGIISLGSVRGPYSNAEVWMADSSNNVYDWCGTHGAGARSSACKSLADSRMAIGDFDHLCR